MASISSTLLKQAFSSALRGAKKPGPALLRGQSVICPTQVRQLSDERMKKFEFLQVEEIKPFVYSVKLNRPEKRNALNRTLWMEIGDVFRELAQDPDCRVIVMSGNGKMFCSGIDVQDLASLGMALQEVNDVGRKARLAHTQIKRYQDQFLEIEKCPKPVIMAIHNACVGGATNMVCFADIRYCTKDAWFQVKEVDLGLAADVGALNYLPKLLNNQSQMRELCYTAGKIQSDEAEKLGLVSKVFEDKDQLMAAALSLAETIASKSPIAIQTTKETLNFSRDNKLEDSLDFVAGKNMVMLQSEDIMLATMAQLSKEDPPTFAKL